MIETDKKGYEDLLIQRIILAIISSIILQLFFVYYLVSLANLSSDYGRWLAEIWTTVMSLGMLSYIIPLAIVSSLQAVLYSKLYLCTPPYYKSRFARLCGTLTVQNLFLGLLYIIISCILLWLHLLLKGRRYNPLAMDDVAYETYLTEELYFLLFNGLWSGLYFFIKTSGSTGKHFQFPIITQSKFFQLRQRINAMLPLQILSSMWSTLYYVAIYYFLKSYCHRTLAMISMNSEVESLDIMSRLLNLKLISELWLYQFIFILTISNTYLLFEIYLTEWTPFKISSSGMYDEDSSIMTLVDALSMDKIPLIQHLGYLDLVTLAQKQKTRRRMLFTLSQPGGHPYNWNCIVFKCTDLLGKFSMDLNTVFMKPQEKFCYSTSILTTSIPTQKKHVYHMRRLVPDITSTVAEADIREVPYSGTFIRKFIDQKREAFMTYLFSKPLINYIFGEQDYNKIRYILLNGQLVIWAAEAISSLSVFSLTEDSYGIVQKDLSNIINTLLSVKQTLDKLQKSAVLLKRMQVDDKSIREIFISLRSAIKRSLYRIVTNFEPYINDLSLESSKIEQLQGFLNYKE